MAKRNRKKTVRIVLDAMLTVMIVFEMFIQFTGEFLHEVVGFAFFGTIIVHMALSAKWMKGTARAARGRKLHGRRRALGVVACLLAVATVVLAVSSIAISNLLAGVGFVWALGSYALWATIHGVSSYALCALVVVHLAMHWTFLASALRMPYDPSRRQAIGTGVRVAAAVGAVALGVAAAKEFMPRQVAQATGSAAGSDDAPDGQQPFAIVSDAPYEESANAVENEGTPTSRRERAQEEPVPDDTASTEAEEPVEVTKPEYEAEPQADETYHEEYDAVDIAVEEEVDLGICTLCRKQCSLSAPRCDRPYQAGLI